MLDGQRDLIDCKLSKSPSTSYFSLKSIKSRILQISFTAARSYLDLIYENDFPYFCFYLHADNNCYKKVSSLSRRKLSIWFKKTMAIRTVLIANVQNTYNEYWSEYSVHTYLLERKRVSYVLSNEQSEIKKKEINYYLCYLQLQRAH